LNTVRGGGQLPGSKRRKTARASFRGQAEETRLTQRAYVVQVEIKSRGAAHAHATRSATDKLNEALGLSRAIGLVIAGYEIVPLSAPRPATLIGSGKVEELAGKVADAEAGLVIFNAQLSPIQQSNLEKALKAKVLDRTGLILEIFGERASTREGVLQVELAHLQYQKGRLVRSWTHLERQRGGFGFLGGPGESQIETDRRLIQERISKLEKDLANVSKTREQQRKGRARTPFPVVSLVGYTNAGKSTLFNRLTNADVLAKDLLFATLDPTMRTITLPHGRKVVLSDTVGFVSDLPTTLIAAFRATLEEVLQAEVILHVRDISHAETDAQAADVYEVLDQLGLTEGKRSHIIEVWNKADLLEPLDFAAREASVSRRQDCVLVSAASGEGLQSMLDLVEARLAQSGAVYTLTLDVANGKGLAWCHERAEVLERKELRTGKIRLKLRMTPDRAGQAENQFGRALRKATVISSGRS
jgi:GTP-binding protein HflX